MLPFRAPLRRESHRKKAANLGIWQEFDREWIIRAIPKSLRELHPSNESAVVLQVILNVRRDGDSR